MVGDQRRDGDLAEGLAQVRDHCEHPHVDLVLNDVVPAARVDRDHRVGQQPGRDRGLRGLEPVDESIKTNRAVVAGQRGRPVGEVCVTGVGDDRGPVALRRTE